MNSTDLSKLLKLPNYSEKESVRIFHFSSTTRMSVRESLFSPGIFKFKLFLEAGNGRHWERGFDTLTFEFDQLGSKSDSRIVGALLRLTQLTQNLLIVIRMFISDPALRCPTQFPPKPQKSP